MSTQVPSPHSRLSQSLTESIGDLLAPFGDPVRIGVLDALRAGEASVLEIADELELPHRNVSHHLTVLHRAGILDRRREGRQVFYAIEDWTAWWLIEQAARAFPEDDR